MMFNAEEMPAITAGDDENRRTSDHGFDHGARYIGKTPLHCAMLKTARLLQGPVKEVGLTF
jgi:hypothetical protein